MWIFVAMRKARFLVHRRRHDSEYYDDAFYEVIVSEMLLLKIISGLSESTLETRQVNSIK